jgi:hypothetical protein
MAWWVWGLIGWSAIATVSVIVLAAACGAGHRPRRSSFPPTAASAWEAEPGSGEPAAPATTVDDPVVGPPDDMAPPPVPVQRLPQGAGYPLARVEGPRPPAPPQPRPAADEQVRTTDPLGPSVALRRLLSGAVAGDYTLPRRLHDVAGAYERLQTVELSEPEEFGPAQAADRLLTDAIDRRPLDPVALCEQVHRVRNGRLLLSEARGVRDRALAQAEVTTVREAGAVTERVIAEHLRPAYYDVLKRAAVLARRLSRYTDESFRLDTTALLTAGRKVRAAAEDLRPLVRRHRSILAARDVANAVGGRTPEHDHRGLFAIFRDPLAFATPGLPYEEIPGARLPEDPTAALLWLVSDRAAAGKPWLPTVAEQDAEWRAHFWMPVTH